MVKSNKIIKVLYFVYRHSIGMLRRSKTLARLLFHVRVPSAKPHSYWDWVTLGLRKSLRGENMAGARFLEMGCGYVPSLTVLAHHRGCRSVTAADILSECVDEARNFLARNGIECDVIESDFDRNLPEDASYDIIVFNPPYVPDEWFTSHMPGITNGTVPARFGVRAMGGEDGTDKIAAFLKRIPRRLSENGRIILGVNSFYVKDELMRSVLGNTGLRIDSVKKYKLIPVNVYKLRK